MGMILGLCTISDANLQRVLADPPLVWQLVAPDDPDAIARARTAVQSPSGIWARFFRRPPAPPPQPEPLALVPPEGEGIDLDKAWHGIHYLLTGSATSGRPPLDFLLHGGTVVPDQEIGYGPARAFSSAGARQIAAAMAGVDDRMLRARFDAEDMSAKAIYPDLVWTREPADESLEYLLENVTRLRVFLQRAAELGFGLLVTLT